jgi:hypothetical protein
VPDALPAVRRRCGHWIEIDANRVTFRPFFTDYRPRRADGQDVFGFERLPSYSETSPDEWRRAYAKTVGCCPALFDRSDGDGRGVEPGGRV